MVYLQPALRARRSMQASALSQDQQNMGVTPQGQPAPVAPAARTPGVPMTPQPGGGVPAGGGGGFTPETQQQPSQFQALMQERQQRQQMIEARGQDLRLAQMMGMALDPSVPKGFRQMGLRQISQQLGVDPKGDRAKEIINTISGLDPQSLEGIRRGVLSSTTDAQPGELTEMTRGILTGQVPPEQLLSLARDATQPPAPEDVAPGDAGMGDTGADTQQQPGMMRLGAGNMALRQGDTESTVVPTQGPSMFPWLTPSGGQRGAPGQADYPGAPLPPRPSPTIEIPPGAAPAPFIPQQPEQNIPPRMREANPGIVAVFGLNPNNRYRNQDLIAAGWTRVPMTEAEAQLALKDVTSAQDGAITTMRMAAQLSALIGNRPEVLGTGGVGQPRDLGGFLESIFNTNPAALTDQMNNVLRSEFGVTSTGRGRNFLDSVAETDPMYDTAVGRSIREAADRLRTNLFRTDPETENAAVTNARIRGILVPLAFAMAAAKGQTGRFLSDTDVALQLQEIGSSRSPAQFQANIQDMTARIYDQYNTRMRANFGGPVPLEHAFNDNDRNVIGNSPITPAALRTSLGATIPEQPFPPGAPLPSPGLTPLPGTRTEPPGPQDTLLPGDQPPSRPGSVAAPNPPAPPAEPAAPQRLQAPSRRDITRTSPTLEEENASAVQRAQEERALRLQENVRQNRLLQIAESSEARAQREEVERRRERIRQAFMQLGNMLRSSQQHTGVGGALAGGAGGSDQDPNAFRIGQRQGRQAPTPVNAAPYQPQPRRRYTSG